MDPACGEGEETRKTQKRRRFCAKCQKHDVLEEVKGHKNRCLYRWCQCQKCWPVDVKRNNTRINVKQRRDAILEKELAAKRARAAWESYKSASTSPPGGQGKPPVGSPSELSGTQGRHPILPLPPPPEANAPELGERRPGERLSEVPPPPAAPLLPIHMEVEIPGADIPTPHHRLPHQDVALERRLSAIRLSPGGAPGGAVVAGGGEVTAVQQPPPLLQPAKEESTSLLLDPRILRPPHKKSLVETERRSCGGSPGLQPEPAHLCKETDLLPPDPSHHRSRHNHKGLPPVAHEENELPCVERECLQVPSFTSTGSREGISGRQPSPILRVEKECLRAPNFTSTGRREGISGRQPSPILRVEKECLRAPNFTSTGRREGISGRQPSPILRVEKECLRGPNFTNTGSREGISGCQPSPILRVARECLRAQSFTSTGSGEGISGRQPSSILMVEKECFWATAFTSTGSREGTVTDTKGRKGVPLGANLHQHME